jgi:hypothetical protein
MRRVSKKTAAKNRKASELREQLIEEVGHCEICDYDPSQSHVRSHPWAMELHHLIRGLRPNERCAVLLVCWHCHCMRLHGGHEKWLEPRQLAVLKRSRPQDFDLTKYNELKGYGPERITDEDVEECEI